MKTLPRLLIIGSCVLIAPIAGQAQTNYDPYGFTTLAGSPFGPGSADGAGSAARFYNPSGVAVDGGNNVYVADTANHTIRKITPGAVVSTLAGLAGNPGSADGIGDTARFNDPSSVAVDSTGNVYVADTGNQTIRKITPHGTVSTLAGTAGLAGLTDAKGSDARFNNPAAVAVDSSGNAYVADEGNNAIRKITPDGTVTTLAALGDPVSIAVDGSGYVYASGTDYSYNADYAYYAYYIYKIEPDGQLTIFSGSNYYEPGSDGPADQAAFLYPRGLTINGAGELFVSDSDTIRKVSPTGEVTTIAGIFAFFTHFCDYYDYFRTTGSGDGIGSAARFAEPRGLGVGSDGYVYVADSENNTVRKISPTAEVTTVAGLARSFADGPAKVARFASPNGIGFDSAHNLYVSDTYNDIIRKISKTGVVSTFAGTPGYFFDCHGFQGYLNRPLGLAIDPSQNVYTEDHHAIIKITPAGVMSLFAGGSRDNSFADGINGRFRTPHGLASDGAGNIYVADTNNDLIRKITPDAITSTIAGKVLVPGSADGTGSAARFRLPAGVAVDQNGITYVADTGNGTIRKITTSGVVSTLAGLAGSFGSSDGVGSAARFYSPYGISVDSGGYVYVTDQGNNNIRRISPAGVVTTLGGITGTPGSSDGFGAAARFNSPLGVAVGSSGVIYVSDSGNNTIRVGRRGRAETETLQIGSHTFRPPGVSPAQWIGVFNASAASGGAGTYFNAVAPGNYITYTVPVANTGNYRIRIGTQTKPDKGIFQLAIACVNQGQPQDEYYPSITYRERDLGTVYLNSGKQPFTFTVTGKNASSTGYTLAFDYIELIPAAP